MMFFLSLSLLLPASLRPLEPTHGRVRLYGILRWESLSRLQTAAAFASVALATEYRCESCGHNGISLRHVPLDSRTTSFVKLFFSEGDGTARALTPMVKRNVQQGKTFNLEQLDQQGIFLVDRSAMARQLRNLWREIEVAAVEMEMVAAEKVFRESLSRALVKEAGKLRVTARELTILERLVERAHMPKDPAQPAPKSAPRQRRKTRS